MSQSKRIAQSGRASWLAGILKRSRKELNKIKYRNLMRQMLKHNPGTHVGFSFIGRNEPCYCGSEQKFKNCCISKHVGLGSGEVTPALAEKQKKEKTYFDKFGRIAK